MAAGVNPIDGVVLDIAVPVETLGIAEFRDNRVQGEEAAGLRLTVI